MKKKKTEEVIRTESFQFQTIKVEKVVVRLPVAFMRMEDYCKAIGEIEKIAGFRGFTRVHWEVNEYPEFEFIRDFQES